MKKEKKGKYNLPNAENAMHDSQANEAEARPCYSMQAENDDLKASLNRAIACSSELREENEKLKAENDSLHKLIKNSREKLDSLKADVDKEIESLQAGKKELEDKNKKLTDDYNLAQSKLASVELSAKDLQKQLNDALYKCDKVKAEKMKEIESLEGENKRLKVVINTAQKDFFNVNLQYEGLLDRNKKFRTKLEGLILPQRIFCWRKKVCRLIDEYHLAPVREPDFINRMRLESSALGYRISRLECFINKGYADQMSDMERNLMDKQLKSMKDYLEFLNARLSFAEAAHYPAQPLVAESLGSGPCKPE